MIREFLAKRKAKRIFSKYVDSKTADLIASGAIPEPQLAAGRIEFVLVYVGEQKPEEVSEYIGVITEIAMEHNAVVHDLIGPLVVIAFGTLKSVSFSPDSRSLLVERLNKELSNRIKMVHGAMDGHYGLIGGKNRLAYSFLIPQFDAVLGQLSILKLGEVSEFRVV